MIDLFKLSVKSILFCAGFLGCAHAELTIDDIVDLLNLRNPKEVSNGGVEVLPGGPPPPPGMGMPQGASSNSFPKLRQILNKQASITAKSEATSFLNKIDKMYDFRGTIPLNGRNIPYKSSKDIIH